MLICPVFEVVRTLPFRGVRSRVKRKNWHDNSFWEITAVKPSLVSSNKVYHRGSLPLLLLVPVERVQPVMLSSLSFSPQDERHGKAWGMLTWNGTHYND